MYSTECLGGPKANAGMLGADFLKHHGCVIDLQRHHLLAGGEAVPLQSLTQRPETLSVCHVRIMETVVIPEQHEVQGSSATN